MASGQINRNKVVVPDPLRMIAFYLVVILLALSTLIVNNLQVSFTILLLVAVWLVDVAIKRLADVDNASMFADLSFAALAVAVTSIPNKILASTKSSQDVITLTSQQLFWLSVASITLGILWFANLSIASYIERCAAQNLKPLRTLSLYRSISGLLAFGSAFVMFYAVLRGVL
jgi:hypothetical protein